MRGLYLQQFRLTVLHCTTVAAVANRVRISNRSEFPQELGLFFFINICFS